MRRVNGATTVTMAVLRFATGQITFASGTMGVVFLATNQKLHIFGISETCAGGSRSCCRIN